MSTTALVLHDTPAADFQLRGSLSLSLFRYQFFKKFKGECWKTPFPILTFLN